MSGEPTPVDLEAATLWFEGGPPKSITNSFGRALIAEVRAQRAKEKAALEVIAKMENQLSAAEVKLQARPSPAPKARDLQEAFEAWWEASHKTRALDVKSNEWAAFQAGSAARANGGPTC